jgi:predicted transposase/invertase (TIGR01784 family)
MFAQNPPVMSKIRRKKHDEVAKEIFCRPEWAAEVFRRFFPADLAQKLGFEGLYLKNNSFTDESLREHFSDLVFGCPYAGSKKEVDIPLLIEHKYGFVHFPFPQLLRYEGLLLGEQVKRKEKPVAVIPVLFVHGPKRHKFKPMEAYFEDMDDVLLRYMPRHEYIVIDLADIPDGEIMKVQINLLKVGLLVMKHIWNEEHLLKNAREIFTLLDEASAAQQDGQLYIQALFVYLFSNSKFTKTQRTQLAQSVPEFIKKPVMNTLEIIYQEGKLEGILEGEARGEAQMLRFSIRRLVLHGFSPGQITEVLKVPMELVVEVMSEMDDKQA